MFPELKPLLPGLGGHRHVFISPWRLTSPEQSPQHSHQGPQAQGLLLKSGHSLRRCLSGAPCISRSFLFSPECPLSKGRCGGRGTLQGEAKIISRAAGQLAWGPMRWRRGNGDLSGKGSHPAGSPTMHQVPLLIRMSCTALRQ